MRIQTFGLWTRRRRVWLKNTSQNRKSDVSLWSYNYQCIISSSFSYRVCALPIDFILCFLHEWILCPCFRQHCDEQCMTTCLCYEYVFYINKHLLYIVNYIVACQYRLHHYLHQQSRHLIASTEQKTALTVLVPRASFPVSFRMLVFIIHHQLYH